MPDSNTTDAVYQSDDAAGKVLVSHQYLKEFAGQYHADAALRARVDGGDLSPLAERLGLDQHPDIEFRVAANTEEVFHMLMPQDPATVLSDEALTRVTGGTGTTASTAGSVGSGGSIITSTTPSTFSTLGSAGSAGTAS